MRLAILHPGIAWRDCADCETHVYDEKTGRRMEHGGKPMKRPKGNLAPCRTRANGCPKGTPEASRALNERNQRAYQHYLECRAVNQWPDDGIVRRNASIIRQVMDACEQELTLLGKIANG